MLAQAEVTVWLVEPDRDVMPICIVSNYGDYLVKFFRSTSDKLRFKQFSLKAHNSGLLGQSGY